LRTQVSKITSFVMSDELLNFVNVSESPPQGKPTARLLMKAGPGWTSPPLARGNSSISETSMMAKSSVGSPIQSAANEPISSHASACGPASLPSPLR
jgi:hypothetical protein